MSTFNEIISRVNEMKPNVFSQKTKLSWLTSLNGKLAADIFLMDIAEIRALPQGDAALSSEPLVGFPHEEVYEEYLIAKIDAANGEAREYQNRMQIYDSYYSNFVNWFKSTYDPVQGDPQCHGLHPKLPTYYITAYGMAVMCGYQGTIQQWLASLKGEPGISPTVNVIEIPGGHRVTVTGAEGDAVFDVMNGAGAVSSVNGVLPMAGGNVVLTAADVGARPNTWVPTAADVGARPNTWTPTAADVGARPNTWTPTAADVGARGKTWLPTLKEISAQAQHKSVFVVLPADGWAELKQTVDVEGVTTDNDLIVTHTKESRAALNEAGVDVDAQGNGTLTFSCEQAPTVDLTVNVMILD